ncbi:MAG: copper amine oxidase N-terminal domain-containing protein [Clostridia bacterium]|nr:copper amine oxidase N-terminal domain-containing protein [Clostridia bacterium]
MKKRLQGIIAGLLAGVMLTGGIAYAKDISEKAQIYFRNIKIFIDGGEIVPKGSDGSVVEPFIMNGATYLPVRAVAEALGKDVAWDGKTSTVYIGKKDQLQPDNYLDRIQYNNFITANTYNNLYKINGTITDYLSKDYTNGMLFQTYTTTVFTTPRSIDGDKDDAQIIIEYPLNCQYTTLTGNIVLPQKIDSTGIPSEDYNTNEHKVSVFFYDENNNLIYKAVSVTKTMPFKFDIDLRGVNLLKIKIKDDCRDSYVKTYVALTDLALYE